MPECHTHGKNAGTDTAIVGYLIADDRAAGSIHDEPDIGFDATDFYVGFISSEVLAEEVTKAEPAGYVKEWKINGEQVTMGVWKEGM